LSGVQRAGVVLGALAVLLIVFVVLRSNGDDSGSSSSSSAPQTTATQGSASTSGGTSADDSTSSTETESTSTGSTSTTTSPAEPAVQTIRVVNGQPDGGIKTISYKKGDQVRLKVQSDTADEIHVHGYDLKKDVSAGGNVQFAFKASIEGRFEIELENAGTQIANLEVDPA
jgi:FtsP/CotA-like multicopper oxidase with cupredoxin domain